MELKSTSSWSKMNTVLLERVSVMVLTERAFISSLKHRILKLFLTMHSDKLKVLITWIIITSEHFYLICLINLIVLKYCYLDHIEKSPLADPIFVLKEWMIRKCSCNIPFDHSLTSWSTLQIIKIVIITYHIHHHHNYIKHQSSSYH